MQFKIGDDVFTARTMSGLDQIEVVSRLMSVGEALKEILPKAIQFAMREKTEKDMAPKIDEAPSVGLTPEKADATIKKVEAMWDLAGPVAKAIAKMPSEDKQFVITTCMKLIDRRLEGDAGWAPIYDPDAGMFMFREYATDGAFQLLASVRVLGVALGPFFRTALQSFAVR